MWPFAAAEPLPGTARLAGWFGRTILTLVTTYTRPGDRVLLLAPLGPVQATLGEPRTREARPYAGLFEAVWTITRLGRSVDTSTASEATDSPRQVGDESESRHRLDRISQPPACGSRTESGHRPQGRFDLVITAVEPRAADWLDHTDWDALVAQHGLVAVVTHGDFHRGRHIVPDTRIAITMSDHTFRCLEHIAVLSAPLPTPIASQQRQLAGDLPPVRRVHHDLLLFARSTTPNRQEPSDA
ncbi:hypothetical protein ACPZ19_23600 [Amycolatopsis lurida]